MSLFMIKPFSTSQSNIYPDYYILQGNKFHYLYNDLSSDGNSTKYGVLDNGATVNCGDKFNQYEPWGKKDTYAVDDIVKYQGKLYKCTQSTQSTPAFAPQSWSDITATTLDGDIIRGIRTIEIYFACESHSYYDSRQDTLDDIYFTPISFRHIDTTKSNCISPSTGRSDWMIGFMVPADDEPPTLFLRLSSIYEHTQYSNAEDTLPSGESTDNLVTINVPISSFREANSGGHYIGTLGIVLKSESEMQIYINGVLEGTYEFYNNYQLPSLIDVIMAYKSFETDVNRESDTYEGDSQSVYRLALYDRVLEPGELRQNALHDASYDNTWFSN